MTDEKKEKFLLYLTSGLSETDCFKALGVDRVTVKKAARDDEEFSQGWAVASHEGKAKLVMRVHASAATQWLAAAWMLGRRWPNEWAERSADSYSVEEMREFFSLMPTALRVHVKDQDTINEIIMGLHELLEICHGSGKRRKRGSRAGR